LSIAKMVAELNERGVPTTRWKRWHVPMVFRLVKRIES
jgi:hypothetical protein